MVISRGPAGNPTKGGERMTQLLWDALSCHCMEYKEWTEEDAQKAYEDQQFQMYPPGGTGPQGP